MITNVFRSLSCQWLWLHSSRYQIRELRNRVWKLGLCEHSPWRCMSFSSSPHPSCRCLTFALCRAVSEICRNQSLSLRFQLLHFYRETRKLWGDYKLLLTGNINGYASLQLNDVIKADCISRSFLIVPSGRLGPGMYFIWILLFHLPLAAGYLQGQR